MGKIARQNVGSLSGNEQRREAINGGARAGVGFRERRD